MTRLFVTLKACAQSVAYTLGCLKVRCALHGHRAAGDVPGRHRLYLLHAARECVRGRGHADASDGCWHHGSWLDRPGTAGVSCTAAAMDTPQATWASLTC